MIAYLKGEVTEKSGDCVVVEAGGIGYELVVGAADWGAAAVGANTKFIVYEHIREDQHVLYGFANPAARKLFTQLLGVSGVGPRVAMAVISAAPLERLQSAIAAGDPDLLKGVAGVGNKTAERIIVELHGKIEVARSAGAHMQDSTYQALIGLGYTVAQAAAAVAELPADATGDQARLKLALRSLAK